MTHALVRLWPMLLGFGYVEDSFNTGLDDGHGGGDNYWSGSGYGYSSNGNGSGQGYVYGSGRGYGYGSGRGDYTGAPLRD